MIKNKIQSKVAKAFNTRLVDAVTAFICSKIIYSGEMDFETQEYPIIGSESYSGRGVFGSYKRDLVKPVDYQIEDVKATVLQNELGQEPQINDVWVTSDGEFKVVNIGADPVAATYSVQLRKY